MKNTIDFKNLKQDFPILSETNRGKKMVYLDSSSSAQKPNQVIRTISQFYEKDYANIHRGIYELSERSTRLYEDARAAVKQFINAYSSDEIVFIRSTTEGINLIAQAFVRPNLQKGDEIILSEMEHHSNIVPWYLLKEQIGIELKFIPITDSGEIDLAEFRKIFTKKTKFLSLAHASNVLGTINPIKEMIRIAHENDVKVLIDGAQAAPHISIDMHDLDCDFYVFSGHKLYGPTGIGVLFGKKDLLNIMPPYQGGGGMIEIVTTKTVQFAKSPHKFEAGTPNIAGAIGLKSAIDYLNKISMESIFTHEKNLKNYAESKLLSIDGLRLLGQAKEKLGVLSFVMDTAHAHDIGTILDQAGVAIRAGHHCAMPLMNRFKVPAVVRASLGIYNDEEDINQLIDGLYKVKRIFG